jgi:biotin synthase
MINNVWDEQAVAQLYELPFMDLVYQAHAIHRQNFPANEIQLCTLLSIKTGACPEDCSYCPQSVHYDTGLSKQQLMSIEQVVTAAQAAQAQGATRFCMGAAWRNLPKRDLPKITAMIQAVKKLGLETCVTLGMLDQEQARLLKEAGLDYYNHNLDSSPDFYKTIITTRTYAERLNTLKNVSDADIKICCGGIIGMGETRQDRIQLLLQLTALPKTPESIPINRLIAIEGTPLGNVAPIDNFEFIRTIAVTRILLSKSFIRLAAGRDTMSEEMQTLCFMAGGNSIFFGDLLLTSPNAEKTKDILLLKKLGITAKPQSLHDKSNATN